MSDRKPIRIPPKVRERLEEIQQEVFEETALRVPLTQILERLVLADRKAAKP